MCLCGDPLEVVSGYQGLCFCCIMMSMKGMKRGSVCQVWENSRGNSGNSGHQVRTYEMSEGTLASAYVLRPFQTLVPVKLELRYPIIQAIRSQWESQDLSAFRAISTMWQITQYLRNKGTRHVHWIRDKGTGFDRKGHCLMTADG